tara:strand:- start:1877 stop:2038 length:162 start_codon:yes stop_codon:yes gene_type:complete
MVINDVKQAVPMARALINGGLTALEITLRTDCALAVSTSTTFATTCRSAIFPP